MAEDLKDMIKKARPNVKDSTVKKYEADLKKLQKMFDTDTWSFLDKSKDVKEKLEDKHFTTQRNYFNAIIILLMALDKKKELIDEYTEIRDELNKKYEDDNATGVISEKQKANFVKLEELQKMLNEMDSEIKSKKLRQKESLTPKEKNLIQTFILFNIYTRLPMRNDVAGMEIITKRNYNKLSEENKQEKNYLRLDKGSLKFILNDYKTSKKYKEKVLDIPKDLEKLLRFFMRVNKLENGDVLFTSGTGKPLTRNALSQLFIKTSKKYLDKSISTTMLRKIVLSDKFGDLKEEMEKMADIAGHSTDVMNDVYIKKKE
jgi:hypothetical protein